MVIFYLNVVCFVILFNYGIQQRYDVVEVIEVSKNPTNVRYNQQYGYNRNFNTYPYTYNYRYPKYPSVQYMPNAYPRYPSSIKYNYGNPYQRPEQINSNYDALSHNNDYTILAIEVPTNALYKNPNIGKDIQAILTEKPVESGVYFTTVSVSEQMTSTTTAAAILSSTTNANKKRKRNKKKKSKHNSTTTEPPKSNENDESEEDEQYDIDVRSLNRSKNNLTSHQDKDNLPIWTN